MITRQVGLLDNYVREIVKSAAHLTPANISMLRGVLPADVDADAPSFDEGSGAGAGSLSLTRVLSRLSSTADMLFKAASESKDSGEIRAAANTLKQVMEVAIKFGDKIDASDRAMKVENALVGAVNAYTQRTGNTEFRDDFLEFLKTELEK